MIILAVAFFHRERLMVTSWLMPSALMSARWSQAGRPLGLVYRLITFLTQSFDLFLPYHVSVPSQHAPPLSSPKHWRFTEHIEILSACTEFELLQIGFSFNSCGEWQMDAREIRDEMFFILAFRLLQPSPGRPIRHAPWDLCVVVSIDLPPALCIIIKPIYMSTHCGKVIRPLSLISSMVDHWTD